MTQPPDQGNTGKVIATAALGLALIHIEQQVRDQIDTTISALYKGLAATALFAASTAPGTVLTGLALISLDLFHRTTTIWFDTAHHKTRAAISTGYAAASHVAFSHAKDELGDDAPGSLPELGNNLDVILRDVDTMFGHARTAFQNTVAAQFDPDDPDALRALILDADTDLRGRAQAAGSTAVHAGSNDTLQTLYTDLQLHGGEPGLMKRWHTTSATPCGMCAALDGTMVGVNAEFDHNATSNDKDLRRVWRNLLSPPRHPNCRCQLELVRT